MQFAGYQHYGPEFYIKTPGNNEEVMKNLTEKDVFFFADGQNEQGSQSQRGHVKSHKWYFANIFKCYPQGEHEIKV